MVGTSCSLTYMCVNHLVSLLHVFVNPAAAMASLPPPGGYNSSCTASLALAAAADNVSVSLALSCVCNASVYMPPTAVDNVNNGGIVIIILVMLFYCCLLMTAVVFLSLPPVLTM